MKTTTKLSLLGILLSSFILHPSSFAQGTAFTYQGQLTLAGVPASGSYDLAFGLFDSLTGGTQQGSTITDTATGVSNGLFTVTLDFGNQFPGANRWLEIGVRTNGGGSFATLSPRQQLTSTPYSVQAANSTVAASANSVAANHISGTLTTAQLPGSVVTNGATGVTISGSFTGNGSGLTGVPGTLPWQAVPGTNLTAASNQGYLLTNSSLINVTLPPSANIGDVISISDPGSNSWQISQGFVRPVGAPWTVQTAINNNPSWQSLASSADGTKLVGAVYVFTPFAQGLLYRSTNSGATWTPQNSYPGNWFCVASSADGTRLLAGNYPGTLYTSSDSGATWAAQTSGIPNGGSLNWVSVASSADGTRLAAVCSPGAIYTSTNSGATWTAQTNGTPNGGTNYWATITSSADGTKLAAAPGGAQTGTIYTSTNSGATWTGQTLPNSGPSTLSWSSVASSADGTKLAAVSAGYPVYTSANSGVTWTRQLNSGSLNWSQIAMSADGTKLLASAISATFPGQLAVSTDSGVTWTLQTNGLPNGGQTNWVAVTSSSDGAKLVAAVRQGQIYISDGSPVFTSGTPGATTEFQYLGNGIWQPMALPASQLVGTISGTFQGNGLGLTNVPGTLPSQVTSGSNVLAQPNQAYDATSASQTLFSLPTNANVGDVVEVNGLGAGGWQIQPGSAQIINGFQAGNAWLATGPAESYATVASSADGSNLVAVTSFDGIFTSADGGVTWNARPYTNNWRSVASSANGSNLVAGGDQIYTSGDAGITWVPHPVTNNAGSGWASVASSANGSNLVAVVSGDQIYTSGDAGTTWVPHPYTNNWVSVASSANGSNLVAVANGDQIYTSGDAGITWVPHPYTNRWTSVVSSANGSNLVAVAAGHAPGGPIYTSTDAGTTWVLRPYTNGWQSVACSADGSKLVAAARPGSKGSTNQNAVYLSNDGGVTWNPSLFAPIGDYFSVASSADGTKLVAAAYPTNGVNPQLFISSATPIFGAQGTSVSLQYAGNGVWQPVSLPQSSADLPNTVVTRDPNGNFSAGAITATSITGNGAGLTGLNAANLTGVLDAGQIPDLDASKITTGTLADSQLSSNVALLDGNNAFTGTDAFAGVLTATNPASQFVGSFTGDGEGLTNVPAAQITGTLTTAQLPSSMVTNGASGVNISGTFSGNGAGLTNLNASQLASGTVPDARLSSNVALRNVGNTFSGTQTITNGEMFLWNGLSVRPSTAGSAAVEEFADATGNAFRAFCGMDGQGITGVTQMYVGTYTAHPLTFYTADAPRMAITAAGNVGIGTTLPGKLLQVGSPTSTTDGMIRLSCGNGSAQRTWDIGVPYGTNVSTSPYYGFVINDATAGATRFAIDFNTGNVGIGTTNPVNKLQVGSPLISAVGYGLQVSSTTFGEDIQINDPSGIGLFLHNHGGGNATMFLIRNGAADTNVFSVSGNGTVVAAGTVTANGVLLTSDRNVKENFQPISPEDVLDKVAALPIEQWNFKADTATRHIGPMAQDFFSAFRVGPDDIHISMVDEGGIALAAIQGLNQKLEQRLEQKETEITELKRQLGELKELVGAMKHRENGGAE